ncbi:MAG: dihydroorotate dehydrogenase-like protein [Bacteroidota bacterium]
MANLSTKYLGLDLKSPIIVSSSELTNDIENLKKFEQLGAGAIVLKSLFEEQITIESRHSQSYNKRYGFSYPEVEDYISNYSHKNTLAEYIDFLKKAKSELTIPVIASINCVSSSEWVSFAREIEKAGADALELNLFVLPSDPDRFPEDNEDVYFDLVNNIKRETSLPISLKISTYFSSIAYTIKKLSWTGVSGIVLFNRFYSPDIDIDNLTINSSAVFSKPEDISTSLKWIAIMSEQVDCDLCSSTGVHDGTGAIKQLLAGAKAVMICSTLYKNGFEQITAINKQIETWMDSKNFSTIEDFRGKLCANKAENPAAWERVQFMKYYSGIE